MDEGRVDLFWLPLGAGGHLKGVEVTPTITRPPPKAARTSRRPKAPASV